MRKLSFIAIFLFISATQLVSAQTPTFRNVNTFDTYYKESGEANFCGADFIDKPNGVFVREVFRDGAAQKEGLKEGDQIIRIGKFTPTNKKELNDALQTYKPGDRVEIEWMQGAQKRTGTITIEKIKVYKKVTQI